MALNSIQFSQSSATHSHKDKCQLLVGGWFICFVCQGWSCHHRASLNSAEAWGLIGEDKAIGWQPKGGVRDTWFSFPGSDKWLSFRRTKFRTKKWLPSAGEVSRSNGPADELSVFAVSHMKQYLMSHFCLIRPSRTATTIVRTPFGDYLLEWLRWLYQPVGWLLIF